MYLITLGRFWKWTCQTRPHWKESKVEAAVLFCVFGVTGSSSMYFVRPTLSNLGLKGNFMDGPWSYRIASFLIISPIYACILVTIGTLAGRHIYFANMGKKIISRFLPKSQASKVTCPSVSTAASAKDMAPKPPCPPSKTISGDRAATSVKK